MGMRVDAYTSLKTPALLVPVSVISPSRYPRHGRLTFDGVLQEPADMQLDEEESEKSLEGSTGPHITMASYCSAARTLANPRRPPVQMKRRICL
jgi:hypothetical protein